MPEINVQNTRYKESEMCRRLTQFRYLIKLKFIELLSLYK